MTATTPTTLPARTQHPNSVSAQWMRLAHAENALHAVASGQVDAIVAADGHAYLLGSAQEQVRQNERRLQAVIESVADVITVVNRGGIILSQSNAASRVLGYEPEELVGRSIFELIHEDDLSAVHFAYFNVIEGFHGNATAQFRHRARDGSYRLIEATLGKLRGVSPASVVFSLRPSTSPRRGRNGPALPGSLDLSDAGNDRDLARRSNGRRTPLMEALLGIAALEQELSIDSARPARPLNFTKGDHREVRLRLESIDAHEAARNVIALCHSEIGDAQVEVLLHLHAEENIVLADWARLLQVMCNLLKNAVRSSPPGSSISIISINDAPGRLTFDFVDGGAGVEPAHLPRIFDSFQHGDFSAQPLDGGLRRSLNIARRLAEAQGGTLTASSKERGQGATFHLTLHTAATSNPQSNGVDKRMK